MDNILYNKKVILLCFILVIIVFVIFYLISNGVFSKYEETEDNINYLRNYEANEFMPVYVTEQDMASKYLIDYKNNMLVDENAAYQSLNEEYRNKKFGNKENYIKYINENLSLSTISMEVDRYSVATINGYKFFKVYDKSDRYYIFKEKSIMDYEVYLDDYTVELK